MQFRLDDKSRSSMSPFLRRSILSCSFYFTIMLYPSKLIARRVRSFARSRAYIPQRNRSLRERERERERDDSPRERLLRCSSKFAWIAFTQREKRQEKVEREREREREREKNGETVNGLTRWIAIKLTVERNSWIISDSWNTL